MKRVWTAILAAFVLCLTLVGCGGGGQSKADHKKNFIGTWEIISMTEDGEETSEEELETVKSMGLNVYCELNEDGTGNLELFGENMSGTWDASEANKGTFTFEGQDATLSLDGDKLTVEQNGASLTFKRIDPSEKVAVGTTTNTTTTTTSTTSTETTSTDSTLQPTYFGGNTLDDLSDAQTIESIIVADDDICRIAITAKGDYEGDPGIFFELENKTSSDVVFVNASDDWAINGEEHYATMYELVRGKESLGSIAWFDASEIGNDPSVLTNVTGTVFVFDPEDTSTPLGAYEFSID